MSFQSALSAGNLTSLRSNRYAGEQFLCLWPNNIVFKTTLSATPTGDSYASVTFGSTITGSSANVQADMRVIIGPNDDLMDAQRRARNNHAAYDGRARAGVTGSTLPIGETSAALESGWYLWVIEDIPPVGKLARYDKASETAYKDYDQPFAQIAPIIGNLPTVAAGICDSTDTFTVSFAPTAIAGTDGASITGWTWTIPAGGTITVGNSSSQTIMVEFDPGTYLVRLVVTDGTRTWTRFVYVFAVPSDLSSVVSLGFGGADISRDVDDGDTASITAFEGIEDILDNTLCVIFSRAYYAGTETVIGGTNIQFVGRLRTEANTARTEDQYSVLLETRFEIEGAAAQLGRIAGPILTLVDDTTPTIWDEIDKATWWRVLAHVLQRHTTFLATHSLAFSDTTDTYRLQYWGTNGGDLLAECNDLADSAGASLEFAPDGRVQANIRATQLSTSGRSALPTIMALDRRDFIALTVDRDHIQTVGYVRGSGGTFNTNTGEVYAYESHAPGTARGSGLGDVQMKGQALTVDSGKAAAENELNARVGHYFAEQNPTDELTVTLPDGYDWPIPSRHQWFTWELDETDTNIRGLNYTASQRWLCIRVNISHNNEDGTQSVEATFRLETVGSEGETIPPLPQSDISTPLPAIPPILGIPDLGFDWGNLLGPDYTPPPMWNQPIYPTPTPGLPTDGVPTDGNAVVVGNASRLFATQNYKALSTSFNEITPPLTGSFQLKDGEFGVTKEYYALASDGVVSKVFYTENPFAISAAWSESGTMDGVYRQIRPTSTPGEAYIYNPNSDQALTSFAFSGSVYDNGTGYITGLVIPAGGTVAISAYGTVQYDIDGNPSLISTPAGTGGPLGTAAVKSGEPVGRLLARIGTAGTWQTIGTFGTFVVGTLGTLHVIMNDNRTAFTDNLGTYIVSVGYGTGGAAITRYTTDYGVSFAPAVSVGSPLLFSGGVDVVRIGAGVLAGHAGSVGLAVAAGGAYGTYTAVPTGATPEVIKIPRYTLGSTSGNNATSAPEYVLVSGTLFAGSVGVWEVEGSGGTLANITPNISGQYGVAVSPRSLDVPWRSAARAAAVLRFGSSPRLVVKTDLGSATTTWTDRGVLNSNARMVAYRKGDTTLAELYIANGSPAFSPNHGQTIYTKALPADTAAEPVLFVSPYG